MVGHEIESEVEMCIDPGSFILNERGHGRPGDEKQGWNV